ncbi:MAG: hypothetical protein RIE74_07355 [Pseudomonadales bacterium]
MPIRALLLICLAGLPGLLAAEDAGDRPYGLHYHAEFRPTDGYLVARIEVTQSDGRLRMLDFNAPDSRFSEFDGDGKIRRQGRRLRWSVPEQGGTLTYRVKVDRKRSGKYDSRMTDDWAVLRLDRVFPAARVRSLPGAHSDATLSLSGPDGWSFETRYGPMRGSALTVDTAGRRFDRPLGWMAAGDLGTRRDVIADRLVAITGPRGQGFRRLDMLSFLRWTLPELTRIVPSFPKQVVIVSSARNMWRGGLSGPASLYVHPDRPLISGNGTSTLLHELMHVAMTEPGVPGDDWIVEGIAEYYTLVVLMRSGGISGERFERAMTWLGDWVDRNDGRLADPSTGANTARAVLLFRDLDLELAAAGADLDAVTATLFGEGRASRERLATLLHEALGQESEVFAAALEAAPGGADRED